MFTAFALLLIGGVEALIMRLQLARSDLVLLSPEAYNQIFTMHGVTMIFWYASPILRGLRRSWCLRRSARAIWRFRA